MKSHAYSELSRQVFFLVAQLDCMLPGYRDRVVFFSLRSPSGWREA